MNETPIDLDTVLDEFDNDKDFLLELANDLLTLVKEQIITIRKEIQNKACEKVRREAHTIKGGALNIRANIIAGIAYEIEKAGKSGNLSQCNDLLDQLEMAVKNLEEYIITLEKTAPDKTIRKNG